MDEITIYQKPTCSTCRTVIKLIEESGQPFTAINYYEKPFSKSKLKGLLKKAGLKSSDVIRKKEDIYTRLNLAQSQFTDDELLDIMIKQPDLIQRPLVKKRRPSHPRPSPRNGETTVVKSNRASFIASTTKIHFATGLDLSLP